MNTTTWTAPWPAPPARPWTASSGRGSPSSHGPSGTRLPGDRGEHAAEGAPPCRGRAGVPRGPAAAAS